MTDEAFPIISVGDLPAVRQFFEELGFSQRYQFPAEGEPGFVTMTRGSSTIGIGAGAGSDADRFAYWVYVDDVDAVIQRMRSAGVPVVDEPEDRPWGERVASVRAPDGTLVHLGVST